MNPLKIFNIPFVGLSFGKHSFLYEIDNKFFQSFQSQIIGTEIQDLKCNAEVILDKKNNFFELHININGVTNLLCDVTNEPYEDSIQNTLNMVIKFGETFNDDNADIITIPHESFEINVAQYIYEAILLSIPIKKVHPGIADGTLKSEALERLKELEIHEKPNIDPRWEKLNQLLTLKKQ